MKHCLCSLLAAAALAAAISAQSNGPARPRLVVVCSVDQLATWVLDQGLPFCGEGGFRRLQREGVTFTDCAFQHACTETGPGHATLSTGAPASVHGIVHNEWFDPATRKKVYCAGEPAPALPEFPEGRDRGPGLLLVPTLGDLVKKQLGAAAKVASLSIKDRAAILMGGRAADAVVWFETSTGRFVTNTIWGGKAPKWLLDFDAAKPADAFFGWNWARLAPDDAYADCTDDQPFEMPHASSGKRTLPVAIKGGRRQDEPGPAFYYEAYLSPIANELLLQAVEAAVPALELGRDDVPDLLWVSFSATDLVGHMFGPESVEARDTLLRFDALLAQLLQRLDRDVGAGRYAFLLSADHGVGPTPAFVKAHGGDAGQGQLHAQAKAAVQQALREHFGLAEAPAPFVAWASEQCLFLDHDAIAAAAGAAADGATFRRACEVAAAAAARSLGMQQAFATAEVLEHGPGDDPIRRAVWYAVHPQRAGDVMLVFKPNWLEGNFPPASHGSPWPYDRQVPLLAMGPGLRAGQRIAAAVSPGLCAVLAARLLGVARPAAAVDEIPPGVLLP